jgi:hypothetical protein
MKPPQNLFIDPDIRIDETPEAEKVITVKVVSHTALDGKRHAPGQTAKISVRQWRALSRHFTWIDGPVEHAPEGWTPPPPAPAK